MAPLARSSIAARIRAHRSSALSSRLSFLPGQLQLLVFLMVSSALRTWSTAESISLPPSRRWASRGKFATPLRGSSSSGKGISISAPSVRPGPAGCWRHLLSAMLMYSVTSDPPGKPEEACGRKPLHLKFQAQVTGTPLLQGQQLGVGDEVLQRRQPDLAGRVEGDGHVRRRERYARA